MGINRRRKAVEVEEVEADSFDEQPEEFGLGTEDEIDSQAEDETEDDMEDEPEEAAEELTFGQILKRNEKEARRKKKAVAAEAKTTARAAGTFPLKETHTKPKATSSSGSAAKHSSRADAPEEMSSRFPVKFSRDFLKQHRRVDDQLQLPAHTAADEKRMENNYAFLDEYRDKEIAEIRQSISALNHTAKKARRMTEHHDRRKARKQHNLELAETAEAEVAELRQKLSALESQRDALKNKRQEREVYEAHEKRERELVKQGKKAFYLKRSEPKKQILVDKFARMSDRQAENLMDRRRKKAAMRDRRGQPTGRRGAE